MRTMTYIQIAVKSLQGAAIVAAAAFAIAAVGYSSICAFGGAAWLTLPMTFGEVTLLNFGVYLQIGATILLAAVALMIPTNLRMAALERSHRSFHISMDDVARAYHVCHTADRAGVFTFSAEFDAVRERLAYLRDHPDLSRLEPDVLEVAAQMSQQSRELADVYSVEKVERAKEFLKQRQEETENQQERIVDALHAVQEVRTWAQQVDLEESVVASQLDQLDEKLQAALPELGYSISRKPANVVALTQKPAAE